MANAVVPRWHGDNYQSRFFWMHAASLRDPQRPDVVEVTFEADGPKAFDDVVVRYDPGRPSSGPYRITVDYHQIKWHTDHSGRFGYRDLVDPAFIGATAVSILERLVQAKGKPDVPEGAAFTLVTTDGIADGDPLAELVSKNDNSLLIDRLFVGKTDASRMGAVRKCWREHLALADDEALRGVLAGFHIKPNYFSLEDMRGRVSERFKLVGLLGAETASEFRYDEAARNLLVRQINGLTREAFQKLCREEDWVQPSPEPCRTNIALRSFSRGVTAADLLEAAPENTLSLTECFDGRHLERGKSWDELKRSVCDFLSGVLERDRSLRLFLDAHSSLAFLAGSELGFKSGATVEIMQRGRASSLVWNTKDGRDGASPSIDETVVGDGRDLAVSIALSRDTFDAVRRYVDDNLPDVGRILAVSTVGEPGPASISGGTHAARIADEVAAAVAKARRPGSTTHFFVSAPNTFSFLLGQHAESMGKCAPYEFDFGGHVDGSYQPTFSI